MIFDSMTYSLAAVVIVLAVAVLKLAWSGKYSKTDSDAE